MIALYASLDQRVASDRDQDDEPMYRHLPEWGYMKQRQSIIQNADKNRAKQHAGNFPTPPAMLTPPTTQAAMTVSSYPEAVSPCAEANFATHRTPAKPASPPITA